VSSTRIHRLHATLSLGGEGNMLYPVLSSLCMCISMRMRVSVCVRVCVQSVVAISWVQSATLAATNTPGNVAVSVTLLVDNAVSAWCVLLLTYCNT